jgi:hypothetical protein
MEHWISCEVGCYKIITSKTCPGPWHAQLIQESLNLISDVAFAKDLYFTSVLDLDTMAYFLALQDIKFWPR